MGKGKRNRKNRQEHARPPEITNEQYKTIRREVDKQILDADLEYSANFAAGVLWTLHVAFGFGRVRLRRMWDEYQRVHRDLREYYELRDDTETCFVCREQLKRVGVDIDEWEKEGENQ